MANLSKERRDRMIAKLEELKTLHNDDASIAALNEIENALREKKYGLVWEQHSEAVDDMLKDNIPVLVEDPERRLCKDESLPWNFIIEGDNLQALYLLDKTHHGKVDCIYIDPPYNKPDAHDWKYNNNYVESTDQYRHSKWLSFMNARLLLAKELLNPLTGTLIVTIDENEVHNLRVLLGELFPQAYIQMVTIVINPKGSTRGYFSRVEEYAIFCFMPKAKVCFADDPMLGEQKANKKPRWKGLLRSGEDARREDSKNLYYPILIDENKQCIIRAGEVLPYPEKADLDARIDGYKAAWPVRNDLSEGRWMLAPDTFNTMLQKGYISLGRYDEKRKTWGVSYLSKKPQKQIENGELIIVGRDEITGTVNVEYANSQEKQIKTVWHRTLHDAGAYGSDLVSEIVGTPRAFSFPKSVYSERDTISCVVKNSPHAIILDFFAGSGTTLNAVNLLNEEDGGNRTCIMVTNNELSEEDANKLGAAGHKPGDEEWELAGIAKAITWPRTKYSINGFRDDGTKLEGQFYTRIKKKKITKRTIIQIDFLPPIEDISLDSKKRIVSVLSGGILPKSKVSRDSKYVVSDDEKHFVSILFDTSYVEEWLSDIEDRDYITKFFIVTKNSQEFSNIRKAVVEKVGDIVREDYKLKDRSEGFNANVKFFKCDWTPRKPEDYLLSNALCLHIKEMIELQTAREVDGVKNVLILSKSDYKRIFDDPESEAAVENVWVNENIVFSTAELRKLKAKRFRYIPREFFSQEMKEVGEYV